MKLDALRIFYHQLDSEKPSASIAVELYYFDEENWHHLTTEEVCSDELSCDLNRAMNEPLGHYSSKKKYAWFYLASVAAIVRLEFNKSPQTRTRKQSLERIRSIQESASNAYKVSHNQLTQLFARENFRAKLAAAITETDNAGLISDDEIQEDGISLTLAVLALDIDHFKQVNDTWGHLYGDQVLRAFGRRLEKCASKILGDSSGGVQISLGHPSGEEFLILIQANVLRDKFVDWANEFRKAIADDVLPTDSEWKWLSLGGVTGSLSPPPLQERVTTASIGVALHNSAATDSLSDAVSDLLDRADTALYRAKAAGRNQVILFDEILSNCGRVLEQDANTGVVALDIGSNVGVVAGQEFKVFLPTFTGDTPFILNDGRTKRTLGKYPRVESARIVAFNVQPDISFAFVEDPKDVLPKLDSGSHLEAIPAGSIGHLLPSSSKYFPSTPNSRVQCGLEDLQKFVKNDAVNGSPFAVVIRFTKEADYLRKYGSVALNKALAHLYREAQRSFGTAEAVEVLDRGSVCVVGAEENYDEDLVVRFADQMAIDSPELGVFAGIFSPKDRTDSIKEGQKALHAMHAVDFARFAASDVGSSQNIRVRHFKYTVASSVLVALRKNNLLKVAYADFQKLIKIGVESGGIFNIGGLIAGSLGLLREAIEHYISAINVDPKSLVFKSNLGVASYRVNEFDSALKVLNALTIPEINKLYTLHAYGYLTYASLLAHAKLNRSPMFDAKRFELVAKRALSLEKFSTSTKMSVIREALKESL